MTADSQRWYASHGPLTDPGPELETLDALPNSIEALVETVQGLLIHDAGLHLYGLTTDDFAGASRETRPVSERLRMLARVPLSGTRVPADRIFGTCRDYALMLAAFLRHLGVPARVRCGFAAYLDAGRWPDHWVCEYWRADDRRWAFADAQLDEPHRAHLDIDFNPADLPDGAFRTAGEAWRLVRIAAADPSSFGHGTACGEWFMRINLARDLLALGKREVSEWDRWRDAPPESHPLDDVARSWCDAVAAAADGVDRDLGTVLSPPPGVATRLAPFWR